MVVRAGGEFKVKFKSKNAIYMLHEIEQQADLILDLENVRDGQTVFGLFKPEKACRIHACHPEQISVLWSFL
jgi:hypothetical protein